MQPADQGKGSLRRLAPDFASEEFSLQLAGASGREVQLTAFAELWQAAAAKVRVARQTALANMARMHQPVEQRTKLLEAEQNILALCQHMADLDVWFDLRSRLIGQLIHAVREAGARKAQGGNEVH
jgi:hypothetical protein